ncbi:MAG: hypothetical protein ACC662_02695 [Planctomycetota bacterium]
MIRSTTKFEFAVEVEKAGYEPGRAGAVAVARPRRETAPSEPRRMRVFARAQPDAIPPTGSTIVTVRAVTEQGGALAGATVLVRAGGGRFDGGGGTTAMGKTDGRGLFQVMWRPGDPSLYARGLEFALSVQVSKSGYRPGATETKVRVVVAAPAPPPPPVTPPAPPPVEPTMEVQVTSQPQTVEAGGVVLLTVAARDTRGGPLAGAAGVLHADGGFFRGVTGLTATGVTDASGFFRIPWRTNNKPTYTREGRHEFRAVLTKQGYPEGRASTAVTVRPFRVR